MMKHSAAESDPEAVLDHAFDVAEVIELPLETVILFGSVARGEADADSDVDLVLVSPAFEGVEFVERAADFEWEWDREYGTPDLTPVTPDEFAKRRTTDGDVIKTALEHGIKRKPR